MKFRLKKEYCYSIIALLFLVVKFLLQKISPFVNTDGPWTLSPAISFLNGNYDASIFAHDYLGQVFSVHVFQLFCAPFFYIFGVSTESLFAFNLVLIFLGVVVVYGLVRNTESRLIKFSVITCAIILNMYLLNFRVETIGVLFGLFIILIQLRIKRKKYKLVLFSILIACSGLMHPVMGVGNGLLILFILLNKKNNYSIKNTIILGVYTFISLIVFSEGNLIQYVSDLYIDPKQLYDHTFTFKSVLKYTFYNAILLFMFYMIYRINKNNLVLIFISIIVLSFFGRSYYFSYLIPITILFIINGKFKFVLNSMEKLILLILVFVSLFWSYILPLGVHLENPNYGKTMRVILKKSKTISNDMPKSNYLWVSPQLGMEVMHNDNSRMHFSFYEFMSSKKIHLKENDKMLIYRKSELKKLFNNVEQQKKDLLISEIIKPIKGKLRMSELLKKRSDSIGLWSVELIKKE